MKRDEMLKKINEELACIVVGEYNLSDYRDTFTDAENILSVIEKAGMKPPFVKDEKSGRGCLCTMRERGMCGV